MSITTIMPTRSRPRNAKIAWVSHERTKANYGTSLHVVLDAEDASKGEYLRWIDDKYVSHSEWHGNMVQRTNSAALVVARLDPYSIVGWCADDNRFVTQGWDDQVMDAFLDPGVGFVVPNDNHWKGDKATNIWTRAGIIAALGYFALPTQEHLYVDDAWIRLALASGSLRYLESVTVEHDNPLNTGRGVPDAQHLYTNRPELYGIDSEKYNEWLRDGLVGDVEKVKACLNEL